MQEIKEEEAEMKKRMDSMDTNMNKVDQDVRMNQVVQSNGWRLLGRGYINGQEAESNEGHVTLSQCLEICQRKHSSDNTWDGVMWHRSSGFCYCEKNDKGHNPDKDSPWMHFFKK